MECCSRNVLMIFYKFYNFFFVWTHQCQLAIQCLKKTTCPLRLSPSKTPSPWAPLKPRDGPRESLRINLKEGTSEDDDI